MSSDTSSDDNLQFLLAVAQRGDAHRLAELIPVSDATALFSRASVVEVMGQHSTCVDLLLPVNDVHAALEKLKDFFFNDPLVL